MNNPEHLRYSAEHEWVAVADGIATVGITDHAQEELGDIVFVELPAVGATVTKSKPLGVVESVKAVSDVFAPVSGTVTEVNGTLTGSPEIINQDPYGAGWIMRIRPDDKRQFSALLDAAAYEAALAAETH